MVMRLDPDMSMEEIMRTALAGDPKMLKVPEKGLMNAKRKNTSTNLRLLAAVFLGGQTDEERRDAKRFKHLATKNDSGLLTPKEAQEIVELFEEAKPVIVDLGTERWVETD